MYQAEHGLVIFLIDIIIVIPGWEA